MSDQIPTSVHVAIGHVEDSDGTHRIVLVGVFDEPLVARSVLDQKGFTREHSNVVACFRNTRHFIAVMRIENAEDVKEGER